MVQNQTPHVKLDEQDFTFFSPTEAVCLSHEYPFTLRTFKHSCHIFKLALCNFDIPLLLMTPAVNCSSRSLTYVNALSTLPSAQTGMRHAQTALHCYFIMLYAMHSVQHCCFITMLLVFWAFNIFVSIIFFYRIKPSRHSFRSFPKMFESLRLLLASVHLVHMLGKCLV